MWCMVTLASRPARSMNDFSFVMYDETITVYNIQSKLFRVPNENQSGNMVATSISHWIITKGQYVLAFVSERAFKHFIRT